MKKLLAQLYLWWHGYCVKHGTEKTWAGYDPMTMDLVCECCEREALDREARRIAAAREVLGICLPPSGAREE